MAYKIGIDATRSRSGGGRAHMIGIINEMNPMEHGIGEVHVWAYKMLVDSLPDFPWLIKHCPEVTEQAMWRQLWWQYNELPKEMERLGCHVLLNTAGGSVCRYTPSITMSRDMLTFERNEIDRYELGRDWLRLFILRHVRVNSFNKASGVLFLTNYAAKTIQTWTGKITNYRVIPHGIGQIFKDNLPSQTFPEKGERPINCVYVSNVARYKHQWNVVRAISALRIKGYDINLQLVGGGAGPGQQKLEATMDELDPKREFVVQMDFLKHAEIPAVIASADIFIFASSCENMPNTLVEAMACGIPIASSNLGPMPEVLQDGGTYFHPEKIESITEAVEELIVDDKKRVHSAKRSRELSQHYSWSRCAKETLAFLVDTIPQEVKNHVKKISL